MFVIFGKMEFVEDNERTALVHEVYHAGFYADEEIEKIAEEGGSDWVSPHHYDGRITFIQWDKEKTNEN